MIAEIVNQNKTLADVLLIIAAVIAIMEFMAARMTTANLHGPWIPVTIALIAIALMFL